MKKTLISFGVLIAVAISAQEVKISISGQTGEVKLSPVAAGNRNTVLPGVIDFAWWKKSFAEYELAATVAMYPNWRESIYAEFIPLRSGSVVLTLQGDTSASSPQNAVYWDNVKVNGVLLPNGDFNSESSWKWVLKKQDGSGRVTAPSWFGTGKCAKLTGKSSVRQTLHVIAGKKITVTAEVAYASPLLPPFTPLPRPVQNDPNRFGKIPLEAIVPSAAALLLRFSPGNYRRITSTHLWTPPPSRPGITDFAGPDGIFYPDFRRAGMTKGIPEIPTVIKLAESGAVENGDIASLIEAAIEKLPAQGGAILIGEGRFVLSRPIFITRNNVVLRGCGAGKTFIDFRFGLPDKGIRVYCPQTTGNTSVVPSDREIILKTDRNVISIQADPLKLKTIRVMVDNMEIAREDRRKNGDPRHCGVFSCDIDARSIAAKIKPGSHLLKGIVAWNDGTEGIIERRLVVPDQLAQSVWQPGDELAAINFTRLSWSGRYRVTAEAKRGDDHLTVDHTTGLSPGDYIEVTLKATSEFISEIRSAFKDTPRIQGVTIARIVGNRLLLAQPLRLDFPLSDDPIVRRPQMLKNSGIEDLTLDQSRCNLWISGVSMWWTQESWMRRIEVIKTGRNPILMRGKNCEIRDCRFLGSQYNLGHGSGTAYVGFWASYDCLMENVLAKGMRHGPTINYSSSGCVIRNSVFGGSDAQFHCHYPYENLMENCVVRAETGTGAYGYGFFIQEPEAKPHGPQGPRNVIYNCDFSSSLAGLWTGGSTDGYRVVYNRFKVADGPGIFAKFGAFDYVVKGNVFILKRPWPAGIYLATPDCYGWQISDNRFFYDYPVYAVGGTAGDARLENNRSENYSESPRQSPPVPSLFDWQRRTYPLKL